MADLIEATIKLNLTIAAMIVVMASGGAMVGMFIRWKIRKHVEATSRRQ